MNENAAKKLKAISTGQCDWYRHAKWRVGNSWWIRPYQRLQLKFHRIFGLWLPHVHRAPFWYHPKPKK